MSEKKAKILIIDDQPSEVKMVKMALEQANYEVCYAYNGKVGIEKAVQEKPDLILLDAGERWFYYLWRAQEETGDLFGADYYLNQH